MAVDTPQYSPTPSMFLDEGAHLGAAQADQGKLCRHKKPIDQNQEERYK
jgi:hypothetical protein